MLPKSLIPWRARKAAKEFSRQVAKYSAQVEALHQTHNDVHANLARAAMTGMNSLAAGFATNSSRRPPSEPNPVFVEVGKPKQPPISGGATFAPDKSGDLGVGVADAAGSNTPKDPQNALLADIEARLAKEVLRLIDPLSEFASRAQLIGKEIPEGSEFCKLITSFLSLTALQFAYAIRQMADTPVFLDDGREYLAKFGLELHELIREVDLDGRRFLAVAFVNQQSSKLNSTLSKSDE